MGPQMGKPLWLTQTSMHSLDRHEFVTLYFENLWQGGFCRFPLLPKDANSQKQ